MARLFDQSYFIMVVWFRILGMNETANGPLVSVIMGSRSDLPTMRHAAEVLGELGDCA